jgi:hypothetical protein
VRPEFIGQLRTSPVTGKPELHASSAMRRLKYCVTIPICLAFILLAAALMLISFYLEDVSLQLQKDEYFSSSYVNAYITHLPTIFYAITIPVLNPIYHEVATRLTEWENHKTQADYEASQTLKLSAFLFVNCYISLFYAAFWLQDFLKLQSLLMTLLVTGQVIGQVFEVCIPWATEKIKIGKRLKVLEEQKVAAQDKLDARASNPLTFEEGSDEEVLYDAETERLSTIALGESEFEPYEVEGQKLEFPGTCE